VADAIEIDASDFVRAAVDMGRGLEDLLPEVRKSVARGALNAKRGMQEDFQRSRHFKQVAHTITYDTRSGKDWAEAQVGPETGGPGVGTPGDLAHIAWFGGVRGGGGTVRDPEVHLEQEADNFERGIGEILDRLLG
jgi:hypothetical protein